MSDPAKYRTREEVQQIREQRDPIDRLRRKMLDADLVGEDHFKGIDREIRGIVNDSAQFAQHSPEPDPKELSTDVLVEAAV